MIALRDVDFPKRRREIAEEHVDIAALAGQDVAHNIGTEEVALEIW